MAECELCPRLCRVDRTKGARGFCRMSATPVAARAGLHQWEEPCLSGTHGAGTVFFSGCTLQCCFCQNYQISTMAYGTEITVSRLRCIFEELIAQGAHNIDLVNPTHFTDAILEALREPLPVPVVWNSSGYERVETLKRLEGKVQIYLPDLKYSDDSLAMRYSAAPHYYETACAAIKEMFRQTGPYMYDADGILQKGVVIRHLILPDAIENTLGVIDFVADHFKPGDVLFSLMRQYTPCGNISAFPSLQRRVTDEEYQRAVDYLYLCGIKDGFLQEGSAAGTDYIPSFDLSGL